MKYSQIKNKLELLKLALGCIALITIAVSSCVNNNVAQKTYMRVVQLEEVMQECAQTCSIEK